MSLPALNIDTDLSFSPFSLASFPEITTRTPSRSSRRVSGRNSRLIDPSPPVPIPTEDGDAGTGNANENRISSLDPRRLTPNLHATLVSEILNLRHEVQTKSKEMLGLEESLSSSREENVRLNKTVANHVKDAKALKQQMNELEGGTMSALDELAADRDRAVAQTADLKKRLETSQTKAKQHSDEANRTNALWENDQVKWSAERRALEHKVTIAEGRLRTVLNEFEAVQAMHQRKRIVDGPERTSSRASRASGRRSGASMRRDSSASSDGGRLNRLSHISEINRPGNGGTLADELALDDDEYDAEDDLILEPQSPEALPEEQRIRSRPFSVQSHRQSAKAFKLLGLTVEGGADEEDGGAHIREAVEARRYGGPSTMTADSDSQSQYSDNATQNSPPPTPKAMGVHTLDTITEASSLYTLEDASKDHRNSDPVPPLPAGAALLRNLPIMVSSAMQTVEPPPSPPETPKESKAAALAKSTVETSSIAVQTDEPVPTEIRKARPRALEVPVIAIHRPSSSYSDRGVVLPPHTKSISCQAAITVPSRSTGMQTEEIRIDQRRIKLPAHLLPSAISSKPSSPAPEKQHAKTVDEPIARPKARALSPKKSTKRISRESKRDSVEQLPVDGYVSDDSFITREPVKKTLSRVRDNWQLVSASLDESEPDQAGTATIYALKANVGAASSKKPAATMAKENKAGKALQVNTTKADIMRRTALVASGSAAHLQRARSPSLPTLPSTQPKTAEPPFPVPDRSSSRKFPWEGSDGAASPTLQTVSFFGGDQEGRRQRRPPVKRPGLRKIRSETADPYMPVRSRSRSPPPTSASSFTELESPGIPVPPLPNDDINSPFRLPPQKTHQRDDSFAASAAGSAATSDSIHVVDAIAQTMIGEWMWKYTRRRKSFGIGGGGDDFDARGRDGDSLRHQRWVWLAPCERAVLWSSKQPVSSTALQGKLGHRKLEIQSVLDVRDDAPMPRGADPSSCFGRSILILTPQRALKFTAMSRERHYLWLSALSFLSQPGLVAAELGGVPPVPSLAEFTAPPPPSRGQIDRNRNRPPPAAQSPPSVLAGPAEVPKPATAFLRRHPVRDSIRVAKGKARPTFPQGGRRAYTSPPSNGNPMPMPSAPPRLSDAAVTEQPEESDGCEAPHVPRRSTHTRKRSNTGPRAATSFRSLNSSANGKSASFVTAGSGNSGSHSGSKTSAAMRSGNSRWPMMGMESEPALTSGSTFSPPAADAPSAGYSSRYNSIAGRGGSSSMASPVSASPSVAGSFYEDAWALPPLGPSHASGPDHSGTMRMDAFVRDPLGGGGYGNSNKPPRHPGGSKMPWTVGAMEARFGGAARSKRDRVDPALVDPFAGF
jgi:Meiotic cell cortex C-terminal pleckstrin homology